MTIATTPLFFLPAGFFVGLVFHASLASSVIWVVLQTGQRGLAAGFTASVALALAQSIIASVACVIIFSLGPIGRIADPALRMMGACLFFWMAFKVFRSPKIQSLNHPLSQRWSLSNLFAKTFRQSLTMPYRFAAWVTLPIMLSIHLRSPGPLNAGFTAIGVFIAGLVWFIFFVLLTRLFFHRVPLEITLHSLNKLRLLSFAIFLGYAFIGIIPLFVRF